MSAEGGCTLRHWVTGLAVLPETPARLGFPDFLFLIPQPMHPLAMRGARRTGSAAGPREARLTGRVPL